MAITNFYEKQTKKFTGTIILNNERPDLTSDTVTLYMYEAGGSGTLTKQADVSLGNGQYEMTLTPSDTEVTPGIWDYEIWWVRNIGEEYPLEKDKVTIFDSKK